MPKSRDLHGSVPDQHHVALLLIDVINPLDFLEGEQLLQRARPMIRPIERLRERAREAGVPVVFVNDNFGRWQSNLQRLIEHCSSEDCLGSELARALAPSHEDYFVLKPKNSGFYGTTLELLLAHLEAKRVIVTGLAADNCVLFTAVDAYMRGYEVVVASDCVASVEREHTEQALQHMQRVLKADVKVADEIVF